MKKISGILTVSLVAIMVVGAARADLASTTFVDKAVAGKEDKSNKVTAISSTSSDTQYPSAKAVYTELAKKQNKLTIDTALSADSTNPVQNKVINTALGTKQNKLTAGSNISINAETNTISATGLASSTDLSTLKTRVGNNETNIGSLSQETASLSNRIGGAEGSITTLKGADTVAGSVANTVKTKIDALDVAATTGTGVISSISQTDGKVAATYKTITNADISADANIDPKKIAGLTQAIAAKEASANKIDTYDPDATTTVKSKQFPTVNAAERIAASKVNAAAGNYATAAQGTKADNALPKSQYNSQVGVVTAANMGTDATTVVTAIKEVAGEAATAQTTADQAKAAAATAQTTADKAVVANAAITAGTGTKITYDAKGLVTGSTTLEASDIPALAISKITNLQSTLDGKQNKLVTSGDNANFVAGNNVTLSQDATTGKITVSSKNTTYSTGTASTAGLTKLYTSTGTATDGTMTRTAITNALDGKQAKGNYITVPAADGTAGTKFLTANTENGKTTYYWENIGR